MRKWRIFYLAFVCFALISLALIGTASWLIVRQDRHNAIYWEPQVDEGGVYFMEEVTYHTGFSGIQLTDKGKEKFGENPTYTVVWTKCDDNGGKQIPQDKDEYWGIMAGSYSCTITIKDLATSEMVAIPHEFTINPDTLTVTLEKFGQTSYFEGENSKITYQAKLTSVSGLNLSMEAKDKGAYSLTYDPSTTLAQNKTLKLDEATLFNEAVWGEETAYLYQNNYNIAVDEETQQYKTVTYTVLPTCYVSVNKGTATYYGNLDAALDITYESNAANTVVVAMQSFSYDGKNYAANAFGNTQHTNVAGTVVDNSYDGYYTHTIGDDKDDKDGKTIASNVTLSIPYTASTSFNGSESTLNREGSGLKVSSTSYKLNPICVNKVTLSGTLTNNGTITVGGVLGRIGQGTSGATSENYSMLAMSQNAVINSTGNLNVFGYVTNTSGGATVNATKGTIIMPFVVYDFHGGSHTVAAYKKGGLAPFSIFDMPNIHARLNLTGGSGGATMIGYTDLYTSALIGDGGQHNLTEITMFGNTNALISMSSGSATFLHTPTQGASFGTSMDNSLVTSASKTEVTLNGNAVSGELEMSINPGIGGTQTVSLTTVQFPISHKFNLSLMGNYDYTFQSRFKFMPGAKLNIGAGARVTVDVDSGLLFYDAFDSTTERYSAYEATTTLKTYYKTDVSVPAVCNVAGTLTVNGYLGGKVNAVGQNAVLDIRNAKALTATEELGNGKTTIDKNDILGSISAMLSGSAYTFDVTFTETQDATGDVMTTATSCVDDQILTKRIYVGTTFGGSNVWHYGTATITFKTKYGTLSSATQVVDMDGTGMTTPINSLIKPTFANGTFIRWCLDEALTIPLTSGSQIHSDTTLYAEWEIIFEITYNSGSYNGSAVGETFETMYTRPNDAFTDYYMSSAADTDNTKAYYLKGWLLNGTEYLLGEAIPITDNCTLTAVWGTKFTITYVPGTYNGAAVEVTFGNTLTKPTNAYDGFHKSSTADTDNSKLYYLKGWVLNGVEYALTDTIPITGDCTLTAVWGTKFTVQYYDGTHGESWSSTNAAYGDYQGYHKSSTLDDNVYEQYYLIGWSLNGTDYKFANVNSIPITEADCVDGVCTLTAIWGKKHTITIDIDPTGISGASAKVNGTTYSTNGTYTYYLKPGETIDVSATGEGYSVYGSFFGVPYVKSHDAAIISISTDNTVVESKTTSKYSTKETATATITGVENSTTTITVKKK